MKVKVYNQFSEVFYSELEKFQKKAVKLGKTFQWVEINTGREKIEDGVFREFREFEIISDTLSFNGWSVEASKSKDLDVLRIMVRGHKDEDYLLPIEFRGEIKCEHCNQNRQRRKSFVLKHEDGTLIEVGSTCVNDFTQNMNSLKIASLLTNILEWAEEFENSQEAWREKDDLTFSSIGGYTGYVLETERVAALACKAQEINGAFFATGSFNANKDVMLEILHEKTLEEKHFVMAREVIKEVLAAETKSEFVSNLQEYARQERVTTASFGFFAYMPEFVKKLKQDRKEKEEKVSEYYGEIGVRFKDVLCKVEKRRLCHSDMWGTSELYIFTVVNKGNSILWFNSGSHQHLQEGQLVFLSGTPKQHKVSSYSDIKETTISRAKIKSIE